jgi:hypothetical protein
MQVLQVAGTVTPSLSFLQVGLQLDTPIKKINLFLRHADGWLDIVGGKV